MNIPRYYLNKSIELNETKYPAWIEIRPMWNESFIPEHKLKQLKDAKLYSICKMTLCIIGSQWVVIPTSYITERK